MAFALLLLGVLCFPPAGWGGGVEKFHFTFSEGDSYAFKGDFAVDADPKVVWDVLTDFNDRSKFISNVQCHVQMQNGNDLLVEMTVGGGFLFIREDVKGFLKVTQDPMKSVSFEEMSHQKFDFYRGAWDVQPDPSGKGFQVTYWIDAKKNRFTPGFVTADIIRQSSEDLMVQMRREIMRRELKAEKMARVSQAP